MDTTQLIGIIIGFVIWLWIVYELIRGAVRSANKELLEATKMQNEILLKMLNQQGVGKDELNELFLNQKKGLWLSLKD